MNIAFIVMQSEPKILCLVRLRLWVTFVFVSFSCFSGLVITPPALPRCHSNNSLNIIMHIILPRSSFSNPHLSLSLCINSFYISNFTPQNVLARSGLGAAPRNSLNALPRVPRTYPRVLSAYRKERN